MPHAARYEVAYFALPPDDQDGQPVPIDRAFSLTGARRGEMVPCDAAEVVKPRSVTELSLQGARFRRIRVRVVSKTNYETITETTDAWLRV